MNYKQELESFIQNEIDQINQKIEELKKSKEHIDVNHPDPEIIERIKKESKSIKGKIVTVLGPLFVKNAYIKIKREEIDKEVENLAIEESLHKSLL